jgi:hypothetical protein
VGWNKSFLLLCCNHVLFFSPEGYHKERRHQKSHLLLFLPDHFRAINRRLLSSDGRLEPSSSTHEWGTDQMFAEACVRLRLSSSLLTTFLDPLSQKSTDF